MEFSNIVFVYAKKKKKKKEKKKKKKEKSELYNINWICTIEIKVETIHLQVHPRIDFLFLFLLIIGSLVPGTDPQF